jgi:hypothetical protein
LEARILIIRESTKPPAEALVSFREQIEQRANRLGEKLTQAASPARLGAPRPVNRNNWNGRKAAGCTSWSRRGAHLTMRSKTTIALEVTTAGAPAAAAGPLAPAVPAVYRKLGLAGRRQLADVFPAPRWRGDVRCDADVWLLEKISDADRSGRDR